VWGGGGGDLELRIFSGNVEIKVYPLPIIHLSLDFLREEGRRGGKFRGLSKKQLDGIELKKKPWTRFREGRARGKKRRNYGL